jgi:hypothetical protein
MKSKRDVNIEEKNSTGFQENVEEIIYLAPFLFIFILHRVEKITSAAALNSQSKSGIYVV